MRVTIAGAGLAGRWHAFAARRAGAVIAAVVDQDPAAAETLARSCPGAITTATVGEAVRNSRSEVAHICTPSETHAAMGMEAMEAGAHVLVEKPMALTREETSRLLDAAAASSRKICPVHQFLFQPGILRIKADFSQIGRPVCLEAVIHSAGGAGKEHLLDRIVADILPHPLSLIQELLPSGLPAQGWSVVRAAAGEFTATVAAGDVSITIRVSMGSRPPVNALTVYGTAGTFHADLFHGYSFFQAGSVSRAGKILNPLDLAMRRFSAAGSNLVLRALRREPAYPGLNRLVAEFYRCVQANTAAPLSDAHILQVAAARELLIM